VADIDNKRKCDKCALFAELKSINSTIIVLFEYPSYLQSNSSSLQLIRSAQHRKIRCCSPWVLVFSPVKIGHLFLLSLRRGRRPQRWPFIFTISPHHGTSNTPRPPPMYALQDTAQFTQLLDASNAIGAQKHSRTAGVLTDGF
jgi:hypothetical protein